MNYLPAIRLPDPMRAEAAILNAPFVQNGWEKATRSIAEATRSANAQFLGVGSGPNLIGVNIVSGPLADHPETVNDPALHGPCNWRINTVTVPMAIQHEDHYATYRLAHDTSCYDDVVSDLDVPYGCQSALQIDSDGLYGVCLLRSRRDGPTDADALARFAALREVLVRSIAVQVALDGEAADYMLGDLSRIDSATYLLDRHGAVIAQTVGGGDLRGECGPFRDGTIRLALRDPADDDRFQAALAALYRFDRRAAGAQLVRRVALSSHDGHRRGRWEATMSRLPCDESGLGFSPFAAISVKPVDPARRAATTASR